MAFAAACRAMLECARTALDESSHGGGYAPSEGDE
jgi:hypothetical protein